MSDSWQLAVVGLIVAGAASYLVRRSWRSWRFRSKGCGGSCGCGSAKPEENTVHFVAVDQLTLRASRENHESHD
jgi:FeoB-associated Cys-rich membrane protein